MSSHRRSDPNEHDPASGASVEPAVFIMGSRRSGTTLLSRLLDTHSRIAVYHESFLYPIFHRELRWYGDLGRPGSLDRLIADIRGVLATQIPDVPSREVIRAATPRADFEGVFAALLHLHAVGCGKARGGDKTPEHYRFLPQIVSGFPGSPLLFVMRDPRDTVRSIRAIFSTSVAGAAGVWRTAFESYARHADAVHLVRYESLVQDPETELQSVCRALGEPYEPAMLDFHRHIPEAFRSRPGGEKLAQPIDPGSVGRFRDLPSNEIAVIERICRVGMERMGYEPTIARAHVPGEGGTGSSGRQRVGRVRRVVDRLRYYGVSPRRWRRGWARWRIVLRNRARFILTLGASARGGR